MYPKKNPTKALFTTATSQPRPRKIAHTPQSQQLTSRKIPLSLAKKKPLPQLCSAIACAGTATAAPLPPRGHPGQVPATSKSVLPVHNATLLGSPHDTKHFSTPVMICNTWSGRREVAVHTDFATQKGRKFARQQARRSEARRDEARAGRRGGGQGRRSEDPPSPRFSNPSSPAPPTPVTFWSGYFVCGFFRVSRVLL